MLLDINASKLVMLNRTGTVVWGNLDGNHDVGALVDILRETTPSVPECRLEADIASFLEALLAAGFAVADQV